jgi:hypothetical protein
MTVEVDGSKGKLSTKELSGWITRIFHQRNNCLRGNSRKFGRISGCVRFDASELGIIEGETYHINPIDETPTSNNKYTGRGGDTSATNGGTGSGRFDQNFYF